MRDGLWRTDLEKPYIPHDIFNFINFSLISFVSNIKHDNFRHTLHTAQFFSVPPNTNISNSTLRSQILSWFCNKKQLCAHLFPFCSEMCVINIVILQFIHISLKDMLYALFPSRSQLKTFHLTRKLCLSVLYIDHPYAPINMYHNFGVLL